MKSTKAFGFVVSLVAIVLVSAGCASGTTSGDSSGVNGESAGTADGEVFASPELIDRACKEGVVSYYSSQNQEDETNIVAPFRKRFPCLKVEVFAAGSAQVAARIEAEAQAGQRIVDVTMLTSPVSFDLLAQKNLLAKWTPPSANLYPEKAKVEGQWYAGSASIMQIIYNNKIVRKADAPTSWKDVLDPKWKGKIATATPMSGGANWSMWWMLRGQIGVDDYWGQIKKQQPKLYTGQSSVATGVERGEFPIALVCDLCVYNAMANDGAPLTAVYPDEGVAYVPYGIGILANAPHPAAAELFANWYLSKEGQASVVKTRGAYSARSDVKPAEGKPAIDKLKLISPSMDVMRSEQEPLITDFKATLGEGVAK
ncbi:ABC transporter substrate-binding protein [Dactylosporangium sp. CA-233914]|uniref:ABC transporter substrate-binding protein n=1 Tax=Dactylosporangium sp. CA-233914 TaxID=3239934 RepID=UPI003D9215CB